MGTIQNEVALLLSERNALAEKIQSLPYVERVYASEANFLLVKVDDANKRYQELVAGGIVARNRTNQPLCENCLRFSVGTPKENEKLISTLKNIAL